MRGNARGLHRYVLVRALTREFTRACETMQSETRKAGRVFRDRGGLSQRYVSYAYARFSHFRERRALPTEATDATDGPTRERSDLLRVPPRDTKSLAVRNRNVYPPGNGASRAFDRDGFQ